MDEPIRFNREEPHSPSRVSVEAGLDWEETARDLLTV